MTKILVGVAACVLCSAMLILAPSSMTRADQPHMQAAFDALHTAETQLGEATEDKGGHRAKALKHVRAAIRETDAGIRFDRKR